VAATTRDKDATWISLGELGWSKPRIVHDLQSGGLIFRTWPPGRVINLHHPETVCSLDVEASTVVVFGVMPDGPQIISERVGIEVMLPEVEVQPPTEVEAPADADEAPVFHITQPPLPVSAPRKVAAAELERHFRKIMEERNERSEGPPTEEWLYPELTGRCGAPPGRQRVREMWESIAPDWKLRPRKKKSAKKSAE